MHTHSSLLPLLRGVVELGRRRRGVGGRRGRGRYGGRRREAVLLTRGRGLAPLLGITAKDRKKEIG